MTRHDRRRPAHTERRSQRRVPASQLQALSAHLSGGARVALLDVSQGGVRLETTRHMRPGQRVSVRFSIDGHLVTVNAHVVRASVVHVHPEEVRYETGLRLCEELSCHLIDFALLERRTGGGAVDGAVDDEEDVVDAGSTDEVSDLVFVPAADEAVHQEFGRGWWLASRRRRARVIHGLTAG
ncbi:hypothetical protein TBR22_A05380 [Luteitalea sp. TBR-22]|uniref:PilZ domain-containing protein n=1 Tax=Luteitalea sp. TBR-22 TaxID=2802971 RepID=UPI001AFBC4F0|nr:PilZ domain-containing protein [Luteitalea sp. TBR-22]BCS31338.1 hypothetical protein TBR22_A05380 [Luteitalea sp. TBR-22]